MVRLNEIRENEVAVAAPSPTDAGLVFIGTIRTPWTSRLETPRQGRPDGPICRIEVDARAWLIPAASRESQPRGGGKKIMIESFKLNNSDIRIRRSGS